MRLIYTLLALLFALNVSGQSNQKYWVLFTDKPTSAVELPRLGPDALQRRLKNQVALDSHDFGVPAHYINKVWDMGIRPIVVSRWLNGFSAELTPEQYSRLEALPMVREIRTVARAVYTEGSEAQCDPRDDSDVYTQLSMIQLDQLHRLGFSGKGIKIGVFDNGFHRVDSLSPFSHLFAENKIKFTWDYVSNHSEVFDPCVHCRHGTNVFSILAARHPGELVGAAPDADFYLFRTENDSSETTREEDFWVAAAEAADSMGVEVFSTSLGYYDFDDGSSYFGQLDGKTAIITIAAEIAASKGIVVVNSAGNSGGRGINAPADGPNVIATGSVNRCENLSGFSGRGPTSDGRIKPDLMALGEYTSFLPSNGVVRSGNGTSYSCPLISGLVACLMQAAPQATAQEVRQALLETASRADAPNNDFGWGIPSGLKALEQLTGNPFSPTDGVNPLNGDEFLVYPNPSQGTVYFTLNTSLGWTGAAPEDPWTYVAELTEPSGKVVWQSEVVTRPGAQVYVVPNQNRKGLFFLRFYLRERPEVFYVAKVIID